MTKTKTVENAEVKEQAPKKALTRAEKSRRQKEILRGLLLEKDYKWNELLDAATQKYAAQHLDEEYDAADLKGKLGSSFSLMEEGGEVTFDKKTNLCALVKKEEEKAPAEPKKRGRKKAEKAEEKPEVKEEKKTLKKQAKKAEKEEEKTPAEPKKRGRKKAEPVQKTEEVSAPKQEEGKAEKPPKEVEKVETVEEIKEVKEGKEEKAEEKPLTPVFDMTELFVKKDDAPAKTPAKTEEKTEVKAEEKPVQEKKDEKKAVLTEFAFLGNAGVKAQTENRENKEKIENKQPVQAEAKPEQKTERPQKNKPEQKPEQKPKAQAQRAPRGKTVTPPELSEDEKLKGEFLKKLRSLGGTYFEYYSVYLLERYSLKNGRRLEGLKISGGDTDGGIDGEIELTDKFGFREVIYIQAKNWDPSKGDKDKWVVGETLLQQFVGAVTYRQAKEGKRKCRGIFVTTSRFTEGAREILESLSADFIGYDGDDVYEAAKECSFGLYEKDGKWRLDDKLLSGEKAFFNMI